MKIYKCKIAAFTLLVCISSQPMAFDGWIDPAILSELPVSLKDDKNASIAKTKNSSKTLPTANKNPPQTARYLRTLANEAVCVTRMLPTQQPANAWQRFWAWFNTDIEADLH